MRFSGMKGKILSTVVAVFRDERVNIHRNHNAYLGWGQRGGKGCTEVGGEVDYVPIATLSPPGTDVGGEVDYVPVVTLSPPAWLM